MQTQQAEKIVVFNSRSEKIIFLIITNLIDIYRPIWI